MAYNAGSKVKVEGLQAKPELNGLEGTVLGSKPGADGMPRYTVRLPGLAEPIALKPKNLAPIATPDDGGSGGGFSGMPGGMPDMQAMMNNLPPWLKEKLARGETPTFDDAKRFMGIDVSLASIGVLALSFVAMWWKIGLIRAAFLSGFLG